MKSCFNRRKKCKHKNDEIGSDHYFLLMNSGILEGRGREHQKIYDENKSKGADQRRKGNRIQNKLSVDIKCIKEQQK